MLISINNQEDASFCIERKEDYEKTVGSSSEMSYILSTQENRSEKAEMLYNFLTSNEFKMQVEGIIKTFVAMKNDLEAEKVAFQKIWKKREKQLEIVTSNTAGMIGSIQGYANTELESDSFLSIAMIET